MRLPYSHPRAVPFLQSTLLLRPHSSHDPEPSVSLQQTISAPWTFQACNTSIHQQCDRPIRKRLRICTPAARQDPASSQHVQARRIGGMVANQRVIHLVTVRRGGRGGGGGGGAGV